jgi:hypothetical protein
MSGEDAGKIRQQAREFYQTWKMSLTAEELEQIQSEAPRSGLTLTEDWSDTLMFAFAAAFAQRRMQANLLVSYSPNSHYVEHDYNPSQCDYDPKCVPVAGREAPAPPKCQHCGKQKWTPQTTIASGMAGQISQYFCMCGFNVLQSSLHEPITSSDVTTNAVQEAPAQTAGTDPVATLSNVMRAGVRGAEESKDDLDDTAAVI